MEWNECKKEGGKERQREGGGRSEGEGREREGREGRVGVAGGGEREDSVGKHLLTQPLSSVLGLQQQSKRPPVCPSPEKKHIVVDVDSLICSTNIY